MYNFKILLKNNLNILLGKLNKKSKRKSTLFGGLLLVFGLIALTLIYTLQAKSMFDGLAPLHVEKVCIFHALLTSLSVIVIIGIMRTTANTKNSDTDFLMSLPIKKSEIILSKTLSKYIFDWFFVFLLFVPYMVLYLILIEFNINLLIFGLIYLFIAPLVSVGISYIFDFIVARLFNRIKFGNLLKTFFLLLIFISVLGFMLAKTFTYGTADQLNLNAYFADRPISNYFLNFLFYPNIQNVLVVLSCTILPFILGVILYTIDYGKTFASYSSKNKTLKFENGKNTLKMFYKKELYSYVSTPAYIINTIIGGVVILVVSIFVCTLGKNGLNNYLGVEIPNILLSGIFALIFCCMLASAPISASSISLEGKNIWLLKSCPINEKTLFLSKILTHLTILEPFIIISSLLLTIFVKFSFVEFLIIISLPTMQNLILASGGLLMNLWFPMLDFDNETKVVKQSLSVLLTMVFGILIALLPLGVYYIFKFLSINYIVCISLGIYGIILSTILTVLFTKGIKVFRKIN